MNVPTEQEQREALIEGSRKQCDEIARLRSQLDDLQAWKESALAVEKEWDAQEVGRELGLPLSSSIRAGILPAIRSLKDQLATLRAALTEIATRPHDGDGTDAMRFSLMAKNALAQLSSGGVESRNAKTEPDHLADSVGGTDAPGNGLAMRGSGSSDPPAGTFVVEPIGIRFHCTHAVYATDSNSSVCYTTDLTRGRLIALALHDFKASGKLQAFLDSLSSGGGAEGGTETSGSGSGALPSPGVPPAGTQRADCVHCDNGRQLTIGWRCSICGCFNFSGGDVGRDSVRPLPQSNAAGTAHPPSAGDSASVPRRLIYEVIHDLSMLQAHVNTASPVAMELRERRKQLEAIYESSRPIRNH